MEKKTFTDRTIPSLPIPSKNSTDYADLLLPGFSLIVRSTGSKTYSVRYRHNGRLKRYVIGRWPAIAPKDAREIAREILTEVARGKDPAGVKQEKRRTAPERAFPVIAERWVVLQARPNHRTWIDQARWLGLRMTNRKQVLRAPTDQPIEPVFRIVPGGLAHKWQFRTVDEITGREISDLVQQRLMAKQGASANQLLAVLRSFFKWVRQQRIIDVSPCVDMDRPAPQKQRDRILSDREIALFWRATEQMEYPGRQCLRLLLLSGARRSEIGLAKWDELAGEGWLIPSYRSKNDKEHWFPLTDAMITELRLIRRGDHGPFIFSTTDGKRPISFFSTIKYEVDARMRKLAGPEFVIPQWGLHDLRRTCATGLAKVGSPPHITEWQLNHRSGSRAGVAGIYQRFAYREERAEALGKWAARIHGLADGSIRPGDAELLAFRAENPTSQKIFSAG